MPSQSMMKTLGCFWEVPLHVKHDYARRYGRYPGVQHHASPCYLASAQVLAVFNAPNEVVDHEEHAVASATATSWQKDGIRHPVSRMASEYGCLKT